MTNIHPISNLIAEIERYLGELDHPCISEVLSGIARWKAAPMQAVEPLHNPICAEIPLALASVKDQRLANAVGAAAPLLRWISYDRYPREEIGKAFADGHTFATLIGEGSFHHAEDFDLGLFIIAPNVLYPDHHHAAPELYVPLTGPHGWRFLPDENFKWLEANVPVWNEPWAPHATQTGNVPFLCIFCWTRDVDAAAKVIVGRGASTGHS